MGSEGQGYMRYLFTMSVGPVQGFIAAARRTRDLWAGSWLLSEVAKAAANCLHQNGATLIFPSPLSPNEDLAPSSQFTVVNKLLAMVETEDPAGLAAQVRQAGRDRLFEAAGRLDNLRGTTCDPDRFQQQLEGFIEFYCAWAPHTDDMHYTADRERSELLFLARKSLNSFSPYVGAAGIPKSSLDGARESVIRGRGKHLFKSSLKDNEYLDAIGLVKRFTSTPNRSLRFESTIDVAAVPYRLGLEKNPKCAQALGEYRRFLDDHDLSHETSSLLYEHESRQIFDKEEAELPELIRLREAIYKAHREPNPPYYALLVADGDRMGEAINKIEDREIHGQFSRRLSEFAAAAH